MTTSLQENGHSFDQVGAGPAILFLHDDPDKQDSLVKDCLPLAASNLRVVIALTAKNGSAQVVSLMKQLGIGRAVVIAVGTANHVLLDLLDRHPERIAAASFVADRVLAGELRNSTQNPQIKALLRSGRLATVAKAVAKARRPTSAYQAVRVWSARAVDNCRTGIKSCSGLLARLELSGWIRLDDCDDEEEALTESS